MLYSILIILVFSFILALFSMKDFNAPSDLIKLIQWKKIKGTIIFFRNKVTHYHG